MLAKQLLAVSAFVLVALAPSVRAAESPAAAGGGFYGGISLRSDGQQGDGIALGRLSSVWGRFTLPMTEDVGSRTLAYGGYRFAHDVAVEAAVATSDRFSLQPVLPGGRRGVGLTLASDGESSKAWNVDVYTSWEFRKSMSLYGRLGYAQSDSGSATYAPGFLADTRRTPRDGVNYGLGLRYDLSSALGLRLEYARFTRLPGETPIGATMPENDQLQVGVQFRF
jgi:opacity protein-like surface antigen